jgi:hypothetical protein
MQVDRIIFNNLVLIHLPQLKEQIGLDLGFLIMDVSV